MSKQFLTRIVAASASASLVAFAAVMPSQAADINYTGEIQPTCTFTNNSVSGGTLTYTPGVNAKIDISSNPTLVATATVSGIYKLTGSVSTFTVGGISAISNTDFSGVTYETSGGLNTSATALSSGGAFDTGSGTLVGNTATNIQLAGSLDPVSSFFVANPTADVNGNIPVSFVYAVTCAPAAGPT